MNGKTRTPLFLLCLALSAGTARAQEDAEGSRDHPAVKRYPGSTIFGNYEEKEFEAADFPVSAGKCRHVEGKYFTATYLYPAKSSCTQVMQNYQNALQAAKATLYPGTALPEACNSWDVNGSSVARWVTAMGTGPKGGATFLFTGSVEISPSAPAGPILVVDVAPMEQKVEIDADGLAGEIDRTGRVAVYGITFATGKADITAASAKVLAEIAGLLDRKPEWRLRIEGHTDNVGSARSNLELSGQRAQAVKAWLGTRHGVKAVRLETQGLGNTRPVADNETEEGRAKNRRVELVKL